MTDASNDDVTMSARNRLRSRLVLTTEDYDMWLNLYQYLEERQVSYELPVLVEDAGALSRVMGE